jgi:hypothetical protein
MFVPNFLRVVEINVETVVDLMNCRGATLNPHATIMSKHVGSDGFR